MVGKQNFELRLALWAELITRFWGLLLDDHYVHVKVDHGIVSFPNGTIEAETVQHKLRNCPTGTKIGLLKTDLPEKPLLIRLIG